MTDLSAVIILFGAGVALFGAGGVCGYVSRGRENRAERDGLLTKVDTYDQAARRTDLDEVGGSAGSVEPQPGDIVVDTTGEHPVPTVHPDGLTPGVYDQDAEPVTDVMCARCGSAMFWAFCCDCAGQGAYDDDSDGRLRIVDCHSCEGTGGEWLCCSGSEWCEANPMTGRSGVARHTVEEIVVAQTPPTPAVTS